jgi:ribosome biogenesis GTPase
MGRHRKKGPREKDLTGRFLSGDLDEDRVDAQQRFTDRSKNAQQNKILQTAALRAGELPAEEIAALPLGEVVQVFSLFAEVEHEGVTYLCTTRRTLAKVEGTYVIVGDRVRFRPGAKLNESSPPEGVVERIEPRQTVLTRADSFKQIEQHPIVANAQQLLVVVAAAHPRPKWGLVDRMLIAARAGGLEPILCLNKLDLLDAPAADLDGEDEDDDPADDDPDTEEEARVDPVEALDHYASLGVRTLRTSVDRAQGLADLRAALTDRTTVLAGHSGVGKSSLIRGVEPTLDLRVGDVSVVTQKGRHTTTSARRYKLPSGGTVVDTPGVKVFGLWNVTRDTLDEHFPDVTAGTAPDWRKASHERIAATLKE